MASAAHNSGKASRSLIHSNSNCHEYPLKVKFLKIALTLLLPTTVPEPWQFSYQVLRLSGARGRAHHTIRGTAQRLSNAWAERTEVSWGRRWCGLITLRPPFTRLTDSAPAATEAWNRMDNDRHPATANLSYPTRVTRAAFSPWRLQLPQQRVRSILNSNRHSFDVRCLWGNKLLCLSRWAKSRQESGTAQRPYSCMGRTYWVRFSWGRAMMGRCGFTTIDAPGQPGSGYWGLNFGDISANNDCHPAAANLFVSLSGFHHYVCISTRKVSWFQPFQQQLAFCLL